MPCFLFFQSMTYKLQHALIMSDHPPVLPECLDTSPLVTVSLAWVGGGAGGISREEENFIRNSHSLWAAAWPPPKALQSADPLSRDSVLTCQAFRSPCHSMVTLRVQLCASV